VTVLEIVVITLVVVGWKPASPFQSAREMSVGIGY